MRPIDLLLSSLGLVMSSTAHPATVYLGEFDYTQFQPSAEYFSGHTDSEIARLCTSDQHASNDDLAQSAHRQFERADARLGSREMAASTLIIRSDDALKGNHQEPLAMPYFSKSHAAWMQYRDNQCYAEVYMLGEASDRYTRFWQCMTDITNARAKELESILQN
jgi:uncharacterized protein YecT (DUF1311 family)